MRLKRKYQMSSIKCEKGDLNTKEIEEEKNVHISRLNERYVYADEGPRHITKQNVGKLFDPVFITNNPP